MAVARSGQRNVRRSTPSRSSSRPSGAGGSAEESRRQPSSRPSGAGSSREESKRTPSGSTRPGGAGSTVDQSRPAPPSTGDGGGRGRTTRTPGKTVTGAGATTTPPTPPGRGGGGPTRAGVTPGKATAPPPYLPPPPSDSGSRSGGRGKPAEAPPEIFSQPPDYRQPPRPAGRGGGGPTREGVTPGTAVGGPSPLEIAMAALLGTVPQPGTMPQRRGGPVSTPGLLPGQAIPSLGPLASLYGEMTEFNPNRLQDISQAERAQLNEQQIAANRAAAAAQPRTYLPTIMSEAPQWWQGEVVVPATAGRGDRQAAEAARQAGLAAAYEEGIVPPVIENIPGTQPERKARYDIPWQPLGFTTQEEGYQWAKDFQAEMGFWPWEGPSTEEHNLGNNLAAWYAKGAGTTEELPYYDENWMSEDYWPYGLPYEEEPWQDWGGGWGGGGWGGWGGGGYDDYDSGKGYSQPTPQDLWWYANQASGV